MASNRKNKKASRGNLTDASMSAQAVSSFEEAEKTTELAEASRRIEAALDQLLRALLDGDA